MKQKRWPLCAVWCGDQALELSGLRVLLSLPRAPARDVTMRRWPEAAHGTTLAPCPGCAQARLDTGGHTGQHAQLVLQAFFQGFRLTCLLLSPAMWYRGSVWPGSVNTFCFGVRLEKGGKSRNFDCNLCASIFPGNDGNPYSGATQESRGLNRAWMALLYIKMWWLGEGRAGAHSDTQWIN